MGSIMRWAGLALAASIALVGCGGASEPAPRSGVQVLADSGVSPAGMAAGTSASMHFFAPDLAHATVVAAPSLESLPGGESAGRVVETSPAIGNNVQVDDARDELYVISGRLVTVYAGASTLRPHATPARTFALPQSLRGPRTLFLDAANDVLYVGGDGAGGGGEIVVYPFAHTVRGTPATPARAMFIDDGVSFFTIDTMRGRLYVVNAAAGVHVYANAGTASGVLQAVTTIPVLGSGLAIDASRDRLYVSDMFAGLILVDQASAARPVVTATLSIDDARYVALDAAADRAFVSASGKVYVIDNASDATSATPLNAPAPALQAAASFGALAFR